MKILASKLTPADGTYAGRQSGWEYTFTADTACGLSHVPHTFKTVNSGVRGLNVPCTVRVVNGVPTSSLDWGTPA